MSIKEKYLKTLLIRLEDGTAALSAPDEDEHQISCEILEAFQIHLQKKYPHIESIIEITALSEILEMVDE
jgi:hypothetical protein